jgi:hypothetical protein
MLKFFTQEFANRAIKVLGIPEIRYFHDFLWFVEICLITSPDSPSPKVGQASARRFDAAFRSAIRFEAVPMG